VSPRIPQMVHRVGEARGEPRRPVVVFCWRGGQRSRAMTAFLGLAGIHACQLRGGHKAFRRLVQDYFANGDWGRLLVLRGLTGVGKTRVLGQLAAEGWPVLDLEGLAHHRGSAFGALGLPPQPSQKMFEARLWDRLRRLSPEDFVLTEGESRMIGRVQLPLRVYQALQRETSLWLTADLDTRVRQILEDYPVRELPKEGFAAPIRGLRRRLGAATEERLLDLLARDQWPELVRELMVLYYDPLYLHSFPSRRIEIAIDRPDGLERLRQAVRELLAAPAPGGAAILTTDHPPSTGEMS